MKKTISFISERKAFWSVLVAFAFMLVGASSANAQGPIRYKPSEAIAIIEKLPTGDPTASTPQNSQFGAQTGASGSASVSQASAASREEALRRVYYQAVLEELEIEATHNNVISGTQAALQRAYNRLVPANPGSPRYSTLVAVHNSLLVVLSKIN